METFTVDQSSQIKQIGYEEITKKLRVWFNSGGVYDYYEVPVSVWESFKNSSSKGSYFGANIKGLYAYKKV